MKITELLLKYSHHPSVVETLQLLQNNHVQLHGMAGSVPAVVSATLFAESDQCMVCMLNDREEAAYFYNDVVQVLGEKKVLFFPSSCRRSVKFKQTDPANIILRTTALNRLSRQQNLLVVTYPDAVIEKVTTSKNIKKNTFTTKVGDEPGIDFIHQMLEEFGFERVDFVEEPGHYAIRGGIVDVFSFSNDYPFRLTFFDDELESIRTFDIDNQLSLSSVQKITIIPELKHKDSKELISFFDFISKDAILVCDDLKFAADHIGQLKEEALETHEEDEKDYLLHALIGAKHITDLPEQHRTVFLSRPAASEVSHVHFKVKPQPVFQKNFKLLFEYLDESHDDGNKSYILSNSDKQIQRLLAIFEDNKRPQNFKAVKGVIHGGFSDEDLKLNVFTDHQIFERYHRFKLKSDRLQRSKAGLTLKEITQLNQGDYVVHSDHGVGQFAGLVRVHEDGKFKESIKLVYKDSDIIFVSIHSLHRISKFKGKESEEPKINKLGSGAWAKLKDKAKKQIKDIARDLIQLYAKRREEKGYAFTPDTYLQHAMEASFEYEDTADQVKATQAVKEDMERDMPMDRLICGDVGFGKTEIAVRAAFKAATDGKQVAVMVPTTILAFQHYRSFVKRLKDFPVTVDYVSRFRTTKEIKDVSTRLKEGKIDILIGTHKIAGKSIEFSDLGLLIIDEEQKFGVSVKEKLKQLRVNIDTLTLTATPIPRTLQFSLMGAREMSTINTPPPNRYPIITEVHSFDHDLIREAIMYELERDGQVYFVNNRIKGLLELEKLLHRIVPDVRVAVGHGQMPGAQLEKLMVDFMAGKYDVLLATTIIESGVDIPNANTMIINDAQHYGLSELHQLRGRVGRTNKRAFCYLLAPPLATLTTDSRRRLKAIEQFSELGSGFSIALQDLDIRGAGNLLGGEQSGFITDIGIETYNQILNEAMLELRAGEFKDVLEDRNTDNTYNTAFVSDCQIDTDMQLLIPNDYVSNITERMNLYRELDSFATNEELDGFVQRLEDRFGTPPEEVTELFKVTELRQKAIEMAIDKLVMKQNQMICYFVDNRSSPFYESPKFLQVLKYLQANDSTCSMKEGKRLSLTFTKVYTVSDALLRMNAMLNT